MSKAKLSKLKDFFLEKDYNREIKIQEEKDQEYQKKLELLSKKKKSHNSNISSTQVTQRSQRKKSSQYEPNSSIMSPTTFKSKTSGFDQIPSILPML